MYGGASGKGWLGIVAFLVGCGLLIGLALTKSDLVNPITSWSESQRYRVETQRLAEQDAVDIEQYKILLEAQTQAEVLRLNEEIEQQERLHLAEIQRLNEAMQQTQRMHEEEIRQAQEMAAAKLNLLNIAVIIVASSIGASSVILSLGVTRRLWRNPPPSPQLIQASLRPRQQQPLSPIWRTVSRQHNVQKGNGGGSRKILQTP